MTDSDTDDTDEPVYDASPMDEPAHDTSSEEEEEDEVWTRETAPQSPYTGREIGLGIAVALAASLIAFGLPLALA